MQRQINMMKLQAQMSGRKANVRLGLVSSLDQANYCAKVRIQPEDAETGWLPIASEWVGNGWGLFCPPEINDMVVVEFQEGDFEAGIITRRLYNDSDRPLSVAPGEFWLVHQSGSFLKFKNDGSVDVTSNTNLTATVGGNLAANVTGNATITAAAAVIQAATIKLQNAGSALKKLVNEAFITLFNAHTHNETGTVTSQPIQQAGAAQQTSVTTAE